MIKKLFLLSVVLLLSSCIGMDVVNTTNFQKENHLRANDKQVCVYVENSFLFVRWNGRLICK